MEIGDKYIILYISHPIFIHEAINSVRYYASIMFDLCRKKIKS